MVKIAGAGLVAAPGAERRNAKAAVPDRTGQRDVKQAQIFGQAFGLRQLHAALSLPQVENGGKGGSVVIKRLILFTETRNKRQPDQRILQPFRFMDGDDLHQVLIALQAHLLAGGVAIRLGDMLRQPAHQRMFALQLVRRLL